ncbi:MAG: o-succinylbenzoate synthase, partial [Actinomycetota bacterium]|nr:o-succinylbenzoate synthase [Actinomycetota bacterium]
MRLLALELRRVRMPLVTPFRTSFGTESVRDILLVRAESEGAVGWGECVASEEPLYSSEYTEGAQQVIRHHLAPRLFALDRVSAAAVGPALAAVKGNPMAKAALEMAVLDAELRSTGTSLADHLGGVRRRVEVGVSVGITASVADLVEAVAGWLDRGYRRVKLKIEPGWDVEPVRAVRE